MKVQQNYKKCVGCNTEYDLDVLISKCEICGVPAGSFQSFIKRKEAIIKAVELHRKARIHAIRNNLPLPELGFEVELSMLA